MNLRQLALHGPIALSDRRWHLTLAALFLAVAEVKLRFLARPSLYLFVLSRASLRAFAYSARSPDFDLRSGILRSNALIELTLLVRAYCHLCDDMRAALSPLAEAAGARITEIDVDDDATLEQRFGDRVPVVLLGATDGVELCHYHLDATRVRRALEDAR